MEEELIETIMFVTLILLTGLALGSLLSGARQKPSLERSRELYWRSIVVFTFGLILTVMWYLFGIGLSESEEYLSQRIEYSISEIIPAIADSEMMKTLDLQKKQPILRLEEIHLNPNNEPIILSEVFVNDHIIRFSVIRTRDRY